MSQNEAERLAREIRSGRTPVLTADKFNALVQADVAVYSTVAAVGDHDKWQPDLKSTIQSIH